MSRKKTEPLIKTQKDLVEAMADPSNAGRSQSAVARQLARTPQSVSISLKDEDVQVAIASKKQSNLDKQLSIAKTSKRGAERATKAIELLMNSIADRLEAGEVVEFQEQTKLFQLQERLFKTYTKSKELGLNTEEDAGVSPAEANEIAEETIDVCRLYALAPPEGQAKIEQLITSQLLSTGCIDIQAIEEDLTKIEQEIAIQDCVVIDTCVLDDTAELSTEENAQSPRKVSIDVESLEQDRKSEIEQ